MALGDDPVAGVAAELVAVHAGTHVPDSRARVMNDVCPVVRRTFGSLAALRRGLVERRARDRDNEAGNVEALPLVARSRDPAIPQ